MAKEADRHGTILTARRQQEAEKARNRVVLKKLCKCVYFLVKHKIAHTTMFIPLVDLLIECDDQDLKQEARTNAQYQSTSAVSELIEAINTHLENKVLEQLQKKCFFQ